jgi:anaerobic magnesium-protoporphyrin IX monomethyl ester cyclase
MTKILLSHSYFYKFDSKQWKNHTPYPPLGTLYAASMLQQNGYELFFFDTNLSESPDAIEEKICLHLPKYLVLYDDCFNYLTKMCLTNMREAAFRMIEIAKKYNCTVIVSSSDSTDHYSLYLEKGADFILIGEAELTLKELIASIENNNKDLMKIDGIAFNGPNFTIKTKDREKISNLDSLPLPAWEFADIESYRKIWKKSRYPFALNMVTSRGCPYKCAWCAKPIYGYGYKTRSPENVITEIELLITKFQINHFWFCDDIFGLKIEWLKKFRDLVITKKLNFNYVIQSRADILLQYETIDLLSETGLKEVWIGAESGSQKVLDSMDKGIKIEEIYAATQKLKLKGIKVGFFLQLGYLGESKTDVALTHKMLKNLLPDDIGVSVSYPLPGTKFYNQVKDDLKLKSNWTDSDDLAMMFKGTYHGRFYKLMHRFIHKEFRKLQALQFIKNITHNEFNINYIMFRSICLLPYYFIASVFYSVQIKIYEYKKI